MWHGVLDKLLSLNDTLHISKLHSSLACSFNTKILSEYLNLALTDNPPISFYEAMTAVLESNEVGVEVVLDFLIDKWESIKRYEYTT